MTAFRYTAADVEAITFGRVNLKALNNWANADAWFSPLAVSEKGRARLFSRMNLIEAGVAADMMAAGSTRREAKTYFTLVAAHLNKGGGWVAELPEKLEASDPFKAGSTGWHWLIVYRDGFGSKSLDEMKICRPEYIKMYLDTAQYSCAIIPLSAIVARVDAIQAGGEARS